MPRPAEIALTAGGLALFGWLFYRAARKPRAKRGEVGYYDYVRLDRENDNPKRYSAMAASRAPYPKKKSRANVMIQDKRWQREGAQLIAGAGKIHAPAWAISLGGSCPAVRTSVDEVLKDNPKLTPKQLVKLLRDKIPGKCRSCYGLGGNYPTPVVRRTLEARERFFFGKDRDEVVDTLVEAISKAGEEKCVGSKCTFEPMVQPTFFRLFNTGDFTSPEDVETWTEVARRLPKTKFWFPTTAWRTCGWDEVTQRRFNDALRQANSLPNVVVRPSAQEVNEAAPDVPGLGPGTAVWNPAKKEKTRLNKLHARFAEGERGVFKEEPPRVSVGGKLHWACPGDCSQCRKCWSKNEPVAYLMHGRTGEDPDKALEELLTATLRFSKNIDEAKARALLAKTAVTTSQIGPDPAPPGQLAPRGRMKRRPAKPTSKAEGA